MTLLRKLRSPRTAALLAPLFLLAVLRLATPTHAPAAEPAIESGASLNPETLAEMLHPKSLKAAAHARVVLSGPLGPSPFVLPPEPSSAADSTTTASEPASVAIAPTLDAPPVMFALTSVVTSSTGAVIVLNGRLFRLDDSPAPGWVVSHIDPAARTAVLTHQTGRTQALTLTVPMHTPR